MMKKLIPLLLVISVLFAGCKGDDGAPGADGVNVVGTTFEAENINFTAANLYTYTIRFADVPNLQVVESDAVLVYILWDVNGSAPIWRLLPQAITTSVRYNFDYTPTDFSVFIDADDPNYNKGSLNSATLEDQTIRVVVIPSDFNTRKSGSVDVNNYEAVKNYYNIDESKIIKIKAK
ncbi:hypothetical protein L0657_26130 [Dyadobacter sp. CY345]|uniref:hypothetical protein n=1 Tax=Dyadobacter sp. CY345 TaxID=2909335 RepID=UPI001F27D96E|nr:hypothetical protein [Dyadobacter sp. CY345]MCF2447460.1 hypothetical protein [Dyadobacter sp. CY345]